MLLKKPEHHCLSETKQTVAQSKVIMLYKATVFSSLERYCFFVLLGNINITFLSAVLSYLRSGYSTAVNTVYNIQKLYIC